MPHYLEVSFRNESNLNTFWTIVDMNDLGADAQKVILDDGETSEPLKFRPNPDSLDTGKINTQREGQAPILDIEIHDGELVDLDE